MIKLYMGGSPCTHWSIAKVKSRETEPSGLGWELFENYVIGLKKYQPDYFIYENNKSMSEAIRQQITKELGVEPILINSALVSAQNRNRLYWTNIPGVIQPGDKKIFLEDILETAAAPVNVCDNGKSHTLKAQYYKNGLANFILNGGFSATAAAEPIHDKHNTQSNLFYRVSSSQITIKGQQYPIDLPDGYYIIRKLTIKECMRLQTVPDTYIFQVSNTQAYKMLGNGWTVDVIAHILSFVPGITEEEVNVMSMYDGMSCGHIALDKLGANVGKYYATEIDKYAIQTAKENYPEMIHLGDAYQVRNEDWCIN
jgi:site-specific DNA-cytosine methylase